MLFCRTFEYGYSLLWGSLAQIWLRHRAQCSVWISAQNALHPSRLKDAPRKGFVSVQFLRAKPLVVFLRAKTGLFCVTVFYEISRYLLRSKKMCDERLLRCLKLLPSGAKRHLSKSCRYRNRKNTFCDYCCTLFYGVKPLYLAFLDVPWWAFLVYKFLDNRGKTKVNKPKIT